MSRSILSRPGEFLGWLRAQWNQLLAPPLRPPRASVSCYLRQGVVYIPTFGMDERHRRKMIRPVSVVRLSDVEALHQAIKDAILRGTPSLPVLDRRQSFAILPRLPEISGAGTWARFYRDASIWNIEETGRGYKIIPKLLDGRRREWVLDKKFAITVPRGCGLDVVCDHMVERLADPVQPKPLHAASWEDDPPIDRELAEEVEAELDTPWVSLPPGNRVDEWADLLEWIANATPKDAPLIREQIRYSYDRWGYEEAGDAFRQALSEALKATNLSERAGILERYESYTRDPSLEEREEVVFVKIPMT